MSWLAELRERWKRVGKKLKSEDLAAVSTKADADLRAAIAKHEKLQAAFDDAYVALHASGDQMAIQRHRKAIASAQAEVDELREAASRCCAALANAQHQEEFMRLAARWQAVNDECLELEVEGRQLQRQIIDLAKAVSGHHERWRALFESLPQRPQSHDYGLWNKPLLGRVIGMQLHAHSGGILGASSMSAWEVLRGPDLAKRVEESTACALSARPRDFESEPPPSAA